MLVYQISAIETFMVCLPAIGAGCHALCSLQPVATQIVQIPGLQVLGRGIQRAVNILLPHRNPVVNQGIWIGKSTDTMFSVKKGNATSRIRKTYPAIVPK